ncbi:MULTISPECIES: hypothetical protein [Kitasatospora]|uniref:Uncharacterized protein n=1 Tax=Kitasatospora cineracea TaxID=88074 RepID=A0A3N4RKX6_9ACTN|nr:MULTISPECIES: hypothetical protein [Kitasatospora]ROR37491.1 hypothetical protein EDD39_5638 [Kitasatospora cineracea]RPE29067.1 hypothetical protein EDD38_6214 [Kitasatospora cineracea]WAL75288.1 hypothetical protein OU787_29420 [Kitasatospora sp. YST-16]WNW41346.1 hypothetical protein RKE32_29360 [Streptomyces sp. Li-HN-5-13]
MARIRTVATALRPLLPLHLVRPAVDYRLAKLRLARGSGDRGAISIELALAVLVLVAVAGTVVYAITQLGNHVKEQIPDNVTSDGKTS